MKALSVQLLEQVVRLHVAIIACNERVRAATDTEALHDLRINLRKLRSLLKPLRTQPESMALVQSAAALGRLTGQLRDLEVLQGELQRQGQVQAANRRVERVAQGYSQVADSAAARLLLQQLHDWPDHWLVADARSELKQLERDVRQRLRKDQRRLRELLMHESPDWHQLRLLIKRVRYGAQAYPALCGLSAKRQALLKRGQAQLGSWHDHLQWLLRAEHEADLHNCVAAWRLALQDAEYAGAEVIAQLQRKFA